MAMMVLATCAMCGDWSPSKICGRCRETYYCSRGCQSRHWRTHKLTCRPCTFAATLGGTAMFTIRISITSVPGDVVEHDVYPTTRVFEVQRNVQQFMSTSQYIKLTLAGKSLSPSSSLAEAGVEAGSLIAVVCIPMPLYVLTTSEDYTAKLWSAASGECMHTFLHDKCVSSAAFSRDGASLLTSGGHSTAQIWRIHDEVCIQTIH